MDLNSIAVDDLVRKRRGLRRKLLETPGLRDLRIAVLGGSTTNELVDFWELLLLHEGFRPVFHQTEYGRYYADAVHSPEEIIAFQPELIYIHTTVRNIENFPSLQATEADLAESIAAEAERFRSIWAALGERIGCQIIQNNFELPDLTPLGNFDAVHPGGRSRFVSELNLQFAREASTNPRLVLQDIQAISSRMGLNQWFDHDRWFSYKICTTAEANLAMARSLTAIARALYGRTRKVLVLDLDNTCWGGVIGDDGPDNIQIGLETPIGEAYTAFQEYCLQLREGGVLLAVCSKNNEEVAKQGFEHPASVLKLEHFSAFKANWEPKHENILAIAGELNLGADSFVFADDNPAERAIVSAQISGIAVPELGSDVAHYPSIIDAGRYFEPVSLSEEDLKRAALYARNSQRAATEAKFADYGEYLASLEMQAEIAPFSPVYLDRIAQLTNKTNQFNLTTRRYTQAEMEAIAKDPQYVGLYGRLVDRFGDNGLVSILLGRRDGDLLHMDLWLMSCRVLKRDMELAMLDALVDRAAAHGVKTIRGAYVPTKKNGMVADHYQKLGFLQVPSDRAGGDTLWELDVAAYEPQNRYIRTMEQVHG